MASYKLVLRNQRVRVGYYHEGESFRISTGVKVSKDCWENERVSRKDPHYEFKNTILKDSLDSLMECVKEVRRKYTLITVDNVRTEWNKEAAEIKFTFFQYMEEYLRVKQAKLHYRTHQGYKGVMKVAKEFQEEYQMKWDIDLIDKHFYENYINFLLVKKNYMDNNIERHVRTMKTFMNYQWPDRTFKFFSYKRTRISVVWLHENEIMIIKKRKGLSKKLERVRDLLLFTISTGMRYSDTQAMIPDWVIDNSIEYVQKKTSGHADTHLTKNTKKILDKYGGTPPKISGVKYNLYLKELFTLLELDRSVKTERSVANKVKVEYVPLNEYVSSHIGRKTFITLQLIKGTPISVVMSMSGHIDYRGLLPYIGVSKKYIKDQKIVKWGF